MKSERKKEIITIAAKLFKEKGYNAVSMRDLAQELGIKAASLYNHISSKQEILSLIILEVAESFTQHMEETFPQKMSVRKKLEEIVYMHIEITIQKTNHLACLNNDWMHLDEKNLNYYISMRNEYETKLRKIIAEGIAKGELENREQEVILFSLLSTLRTLYLWYSKKSNLDLNLLKQDLTNTLLLGIVKT